MGIASITSSSGLSSPSAIAGSESVIRFTHSRCIGSRGVLHPNTMAVKIVSISPILLESKKCTAFLILLYIILPSSTALTIVAKLSSVIIMSDAPFATSVPFLPIAQPISAAFSAGASFTPSPVMATTFPFLL